MRDRLEDVLSAEEAVTCPIVDLEVLYPARSRAEYELWRADRRVGYDSMPLTPASGNARSRCNESSRRVLAIAAPQFQIY